MNDNLDMPCATDLFDDGAENESFAPPLPNGSHWKEVARLYGPPESSWSERLREIPLRALVLVSIAVKVLDVVGRR